MAGALEGIKVLDLTQVYSGPFCTMLLKDMGAEIIKIERPGSGDLTRSDVPHTEGMEGGAYITLNRGKKSVTLNLASEKGLKICKELAKKVDVLVENFSPGTMDKLGLSSKVLCKLNPSLIFASISAYGQTGPLRDYPGFDPVAQAMGGLTAVTGFPDNPTRCGVSIADFSAGFFTAYAIVNALFHRLKTGEGQTIDISMQESIWQLTSIEFAPYYFLNGVNPPRLGNRHSAMIPCNLYPTKDGRLFIMAGVLRTAAQSLYRNGTGLTSSNHRSAGTRTSAISTAMKSMKLSPTGQRRKRPKKSWSFYAKQTYRVQNSHLRRSVPRPAAFKPECYNRGGTGDIGKVKVPGSPFKLSKTPGRIDYPAPYLGEHNQAVLSEMLGFSQDEMTKLADEGIF